MGMIASLPREHRLHIEIGFKVCALHQIPYLLLQIWKLHRVQLFYGVVLIDELIQLSQRSVSFSCSHRRCHVVDDDSMRASLRLAAFTGVIQNKGVNKRKIAEQQIGIAFARKPNTLTRKPFKRSMLSHVHNGICTPTTFDLRCREPAIEGGIVMRRREIGCVINSIWIETITAWRLQRNKCVAKLHRGKQIVVFITPRLLLLDSNNLAPNSWQ